MQEIRETFGLKVPLTLFLAELFALFAFVFAAELYDANKEEDRQDAKTHSNSNC